MDQTSELKSRAEAINAELARVYPDAHCSLNFKNPFQLTVATILSAQCTDERVNMVTPELFRRYPTPQALADAETAELEEVIRTTGFFRNKTKSLKNMSAQVVADHRGKIPKTMDELRVLAGVGRKTANVVLGNCFGVPGLTIDTHMQRVNQRLGLTHQTDPEKIERDLMPLIPQPDWTNYSHRIITHGREICTARRPQCERCPLTPWCDYYAKYQLAAAEKTDGVAPPAPARPGKKKGTSELSKTQSKPRAPRRK